MTVPIFGLDFRAGGGRSAAWMPAHLLAADGRGIVGSPERLAAYEPLVFVTYGFNVAREPGIDQLAHFGRLLTTAGVTAGAICWVSWPGDGFGGPLCYPAQEAAADDTATFLAQLLRERVRPRQPVSFVAHSLGSRVVFRAMSLLAGTAVQVGEVVVMAAAVDGDAPSRLKRYRAGVVGAERVSVLFSEHDRVLKFAFPVGDLVASIFYGGATTSALGLRGPRDGDGASEAVPSNVKKKRSEGADHGDIGHWTGPCVSPRAKQQTRACSPAGTKVCRCRALRGLLSRAYSARHWTRRCRRKRGERRTGATCAHS